MKNKKKLTKEDNINYKPIITNHAIISSSPQAYELIKQLWDNEKINLQEQFATLFFNQSKKMIGWKVLSTGNMTKCIVDIKLLVSVALHCMCTHIMIIHNHPSNNLKASQCDENIIGTVKNALKLIDVELIDHLIIAEKEYLSFNDEGFL